MFERMQIAQHRVGSSKITVCYDRLSTRFIVEANDKIVFSKLLLFFPFHNATLMFDKTKYKLSIRWFVLWRSRLSKNNKIVVKELLYRRRKRSIGLLIYFLFASSVKLAIGFTT